TDPAPRRRAQDRDRGVRAQAKLQARRRLFLRRFEALDEDERLLHRLRPLPTSRSIRYHAGETRIARFFPIGEEGATRTDRRDRRARSRPFPTGTYLEEFTRLDGGRRHRTFLRAKDPRVTGLVP